MRRFLGMILCFCARCALSLANVIDPDGITNASLKARIFNKKVDFAFFRYGRPQATCYMTVERWYDFKDGIDAELAKVGK